MEVSYQLFVDTFTTLIAIAFPIAITIGIVEKICTMFFDMIFGRNLKI